MKDSRVTRARMVQISFICTMYFDVEQPGVQFGNIMTVEPQEKALHLVKQSTESIHNIWWQTQTEHVWKLTLFQQFSFTPPFYN